MCVFAAAEWEPSELEFFGRKGRKCYGVIWFLSILPLSLSLSSAPLLWCRVERSPSPESVTPSRARRFPPVPTACAGKLLCRQRLELMPIVSLGAGHRNGIAIAGAKDTLV